MARELIEELNSELAGLYPEEGATHLRLGPEEVQPGRGAFLVAVGGPTAVALGRSACAGEVTRWLIPEQSGGARPVQRPPARTPTPPQSRRRPAGQPPGRLGGAQSQTVIDPAGYMAPFAP
jgi:hypothetical protein